MYVTVRNQLKITARLEQPKLRLHILVEVVLRQNGEYNKKEEIQKAESALWWDAHHNWIFMI